MPTCPRTVTEVVVPDTVASAAPPSQPFISEIHYDNDGTDAGEFVEVHLPPGASSAGLSIVLCERVSDVCERASDVCEVAPSPGAVTRRAASRGAGA